MAAPARHRLNVFVEPAHARQLAAFCAQRDLSKSAVMAAALSAFLSPEDAHQRQAVVERRLDMLSRQFGRLERDQHILAETLALYVRVYLTVSLPVPEGHEEAARAQGRVRYAQFVEQLGRLLQGGQTLMPKLREAFEGGGGQEAERAADDSVPLQGATADAATTREAADDATH